MDRNGLEIAEYIKEVNNDLSEGAKIQFCGSTFLYKHYAIYIGNNEIIHFKHNGSVFVVERSNLNTEANTGPPQICNELDNNFTSLPPVDIVNKACSYLGREDYSLLFFNCEHLSNICRYGKKICEQIFTYTLLAVVLMFVSVLPFKYFGHLSEAYLFMMFVIGFGISLFALWFHLKLFYYLAQYKSGQVIDCFVILVVSVISYVLGHFLNRILFYLIPQSIHLRLYSTFPMTIMCKLMPDKFPNDYNV